MLGMAAVASAMYQDIAPTSEEHHQKEFITLALNLEFRIPTVPYGFVGVSFEAESPGDLKRAVLDCDSDLWTAVGDAYARAAGMAVIGKDLGGQVVGEHIDPSWPQEAQEAPAWGG